MNPGSDKATFAMNMSPKTSPSELHRFKRELNRFAKIIGLIKRHQERLTSEA
jgi:hypothetical protein